MIRVCINKLTQSEVEGGWNWQDGSKWKYENWDKSKQQDESNIYNDKENCGLLFMTGGWGTQPCDGDQKNNYVCGKKAQKRNK